MSETPGTFAQAREQFLTMVSSVRPDLHRYCARLTGSVVEGEDIVQDALAKAFYALSLQPDVPALRPWLFRIAHNQAMDRLKSHTRKLTDLRDDLEDVSGLEERVEPAVLRAALRHFLALPLAQRSAVILKDVLGCSLEETAETMDTTVLAVKAALVRGRARLLAAAAEEDEPTQIQTLAQATGQARAPRAPEPDAAERAALDRYVSLFNARDWEGLRALIGEDCRLDLVSKSQRRGKAVGMYFGRYEKEDVSLRVVRLEGSLALAAHVGGASEPSYFVLLDWDGDRVASIRDFRYVPYIAADAALESP